MAEFENSFTQKQPDTKFTPETTGKILLTYQGRQNLMAGAVGFERFLDSKPWMSEYGASSHSLDYLTKITSMLRGHGFDDIVQKAFSGMEATAERTREDREHCYRNMAQAAAEFDDIPRAELYLDRAGFGDVLYTLPALARAYQRANRDVTPVLDRAIEQVGRHSERNQMPLLDPTDLSDFHEDVLKRTGETPHEHAARMNSFLLSLEVSGYVHLAEFLAEFGGDPRPAMNDFHATVAAYKEQGLEVGLRPSIIVQTYARMGDFEYAQEMADSLTEPAERLPAYQYLVKELLNKDFIDEAIDIATNIGNSAIAAEMFADAAIARAKKGVNPSYEIYGTLNHMNDMSSATDIPDGSALKVISLEDYDSDMHSNPRAYAERQANNERQRLQVIFLSKIAQAAHIGGLDSLPYLQRLASVIPEASTADKGRKISLEVARASDACGYDATPFLRYAIDVSLADRAAIFDDTFKTAIDLGYFDVADEIIDKIVASLQKFPELKNEPTAEPLKRLRDRQRRSYRPMRKEQITQSTEYLLQLGREQLKRGLSQEELAKLDRHNVRTAYWNGEPDLKAAVIELNIDKL